MMIIRQIIVLAIGLLSLFWTGAASAAWQGYMALDADPTSSTIVAGNHEGITLFKRTDGTLKRVAHRPYDTTMYRLAISTNSRWVVTVNDVEQRVFDAQRGLRLVAKLPLTGSDYSEQNIFVLGDTLVSYSSPDDSRAKTSFVSYRLSSSGAKRVTKVTKTLSGGLGNYPDFGAVTETLLRGTMGDVYVDPATSALDVRAPFAMPRGFNAEVLCGLGSNVALLGMGDVWDFSVTSPDETPADQSPASIIASATLGDWRSSPQRQCATGGGIALSNRETPLGRGPTTLVLRFDNALRSFAPAVKVKNLAFARVSGDARYAVGLAAAKGYETFGDVRIVEIVGGDAARESRVSISPKPTILFMHAFKAKQLQAIGYTAGPLSARVRCGRSDTGWKAMTFAGDTREKIRHPLAGTPNWKLGGIKRARTDSCKVWFKDRNGVTKAKSLTAKNTYF